MLASTRCWVACAMAAVAILWSTLNVPISVGAVLLNKSEKRTSLLPTQRMAVVGFRDTASASSVGAVIEQFGFNISTAFTSIGLEKSGGHDDGSPTRLATVKPGTATSIVCTVFSRLTGYAVVTTAYGGCTLVEIWGYPGGGKSGRYSKTPAWVAITLA